jgi:hypothetical protein
MDNFTLQPCKKQIANFLYPGRKWLLTLPTQPPKHPELDGILRDRRDPPP